MLSTDSPRLFFHLLGFLGFFSEEANNAGRATNMSRKNHLGMNDSITGYSWGRGCSVTPTCHHELIAVRVDAHSAVKALYLNIALA